MEENEIHLNTDSNINNNYFIYENTYEIPFFDNNNIKNNKILNKNKIGIFPSNILYIISSNFIILFNLKDFLKIPSIINYPKDSHILKIKKFIDKKTNEYFLIILYLLNNNYFICVKNILTKKIFFEKKININNNNNIELINFIVIDLNKYILITNDKKFFIYDINNNNNFYIYNESFNFIKYIKDNNNIIFIDNNNILSTYNIIEEKKIFSFNFKIISSFNNFNIDFIKIINSNMLIIIGKNINTNINVINNNDSDNEEIECKIFIFFDNNEKKFNKNFLSFSIDIYNDINNVFIDYEINNKNKIIIFITNNELLIIDKFIFNYEIGKKINIENRISINLIYNNVFDSIKILNDLGKILLINKNNELVVFKQNENLINNIINDDNNLTEDFNKNNNENENISNNKSEVIEINSNYNNKDIENISNNNDEKKSFDKNKNLICSDNNSDIKEDNKIDINHIKLKYELKNKILENKFEIINIKSELFNKLINNNNFSKYFSIFTSYINKMENYIKTFQNNDSFYSNLFQEISSNLSSISSYLNFIILYSSYKKDLILNEYSPLFNKYKNIYEINKKKLFFISNEKFLSLLNKKYKKNLGIKFENILKIYNYYSDIFYNKNILYLNFINENKYIDDNENNIIKYVENIKELYYKKRIHLKINDQLYNNVIHNVLEMLNKIYQKIENKRLKIENINKNIELDNFNDNYIDDNKNNDLSYNYHINNENKTNHNNYEKRKKNLLQKVLETTVIKKNIIKDIYISPNCLDISNLKEKILNKNFHN